MISVFSMLMMLVVILIPVLVIISLVILLSSRRIDKNRRYTPTPGLADPTQYPWNAKHGPWYFGNWGVTAKINETISEGRRQRYPRGSKHRH